jgi:hypothetical protein
VLLEYGDETTEELIEFLGGGAPAEAKVEASRIIDELAISIRDEIDPGFGFSRYAERLGAGAEDFGAVEREVRRRGVIDGPLEKHLKDAITETAPSIIGVTCPFPGMLVAAFKIARYVRRRHPSIRLVIGGGFVSTELRQMNDRRALKYFDDFIFDEGYAPMAALMGIENAAVPPFVAPDYEGIDWDEYFDVVETDNPMHQLWSTGKWRKLVMARGCYWHKCAFCDVKLPYIGAFRCRRKERGGRHGENGDALPFRRRSDAAGACARHFRGDNPPEIPLPVVGEYPFRCVLYPCLGEADGEGGVRRRDRRT